MRTQLKQVLARCGGAGPPRGTTVLIYHRVGGRSPDERDVATDRFAEQVDLLGDSGTVATLDEALDAGDRGDPGPRTVLTFDDGFRDLYDNGWPLLRAAGLPFTVYLATGYVGGTMHWEGSTARDTGAPALAWDHVREMVASGLCTVGNHTHDHVRPELLVADQLDRCSDAVERELGIRPSHFAYTWGVPVPRMEGSLRARFRSSVSGELGRNLPGTDPHRLRRVPVRGSDPLDFFRAKVVGSLLPERLYSGAVVVAKRLGAAA